MGPVVRAAALALFFVVLGLPASAEARTPLPTIETARPKRVRLLDVRMPVRMGWGYSALYRAPAYDFGFEGQASFVELTESMWLHVNFGESAVLPAVVRREGQRRPGFFGVDLGLGLSRYAPGGPAFFVSATTGPRWDSQDRGFRPDGFGVTGRAEVYPFFMSIPEIVDERPRWFRGMFLSGLHLWVSTRYDRITGRHGNTFAGGIGLDLGRAVIVPILRRR